MEYRGKGKFLFQGEGILIVKCLKISRTTDQSSYNVPVFLWNALHMTLSGWQCWQNHIATAYSFYTVIVELTRKEDIQWLTISLLLGNGVRETSFRAFTI